MSTRRWRSRAATVSGSDKDEAPLPPRAPRRAALQLSQSTAGSGSVNIGSLATLLAGSKPAGASGVHDNGAAAAAAASAAAPAPSAAGGGGAAVAPARHASRGRATMPKQAGVISVPAAAAAGSGSQAKLLAEPGQLWVEKYAPRSEAELVVHKKKVQEVREWLEQQKASLGRPAASRLLVLSGPPGCGKSSVLSALAASLVFDISEWRPPSAVGWEEAQYAGIQRKSKLDEFNEFVARTKMPHLSISSCSRSGGGSRRGGADSRSQAQPIAAAAAAAGRDAAGSGGSQGGAEARPGRLPPSLLPTLVVVENLPHASSPGQRQQIADALGDLAAGARFPVVVVATETSGKAQQEKGLSAAEGTYRGLHKEVIGVLEAHSASTISFNPFTALNTAKALHAILERERRPLPEADVLAIAEQANGDLYNAISTLQFVCTGVAAAPVAAAAAKPNGRGTKRKAAAATGSSDKEALPADKPPSQAAFVLRDSSISLFHALGKLLYNKRLRTAASQQPGSSSLSAPATAAASQTQQQQQQQQQQQEASDSQPSGTQQCNAYAFWQAPGSSSSGAAVGLPVATWAQRPPMEFDPEAALAAGGLEAGSVTAFLHENVLHFIEDGAIGDAAGCLEQLSAADAMASGRRWGTNDTLMEDDDVASATLLDAAAASTAARGICFHNAHPAPRRFLPLKAPSVFAAAKGQAANAAELTRCTAPAWAVQGSIGSLEPAGRLAVELLPYARAIAQRCPAPALQRLQPARWTRFWNGQLFEQQSSVAGAGGGGGWLLEQDERADGGGQAAQGQHLPEDEIEESEDEDDW